MPLVPGAPRLFDPGLTNGVFGVSVSTVVGRVYYLEYREALLEGAGGWTRLPGVNGNGAVQRLTDPAAVLPQRYYRVAVE